MSSELSYLHKVKPPPALSKETVGVWNGWLQKGDKEVAREAAAKGLHIKLAITFLADRKGIGVNEAETWFKNEVIRWAYELLERKQFFRALHILNNAELDSGCEISQVFYSTSSKDLREYIGNQLLKAEKLDENMKQLWEFLELIYKNSDLFESSLEIESLEYLNDLPSDKKAEIASILFLNTEDNRVTPFLTPETLWNHLLVTNDLRNLLIWINIKFNSEFEDLIESTFLDQFKKFPITPEMLGTILSSEFNQPLKNDLYNELSKYGIFSDSEKDDVVMILKRLKDSGRIANLFEILPKNSSVLTVREFMEILVDHCLDNDLFSILNVCVENFIVKPAGSKHLEVIRDFRQLVRRFDEDSLRRNVLSVARVLGDDLVQYFDDNPVMLLALILFTKDADIVELITRNSVFTVNDVSLNQSLKNVIEVNPILRISCDKFTGKFSKPTVTAYELITKHLRIDSEILFEFRFKNTELPHFNNEQIVAECGYSKTVSYKFYLKQARPCVAANFFKKNLVRGEDLVVAEKKAGKVAILNFDCDDIAAACVVFVEMIGGKSIKLRVLLKAAKILSRAGYTKEYVQEVLLNSDDEPYNLQNLLETIVMNSIEFNSFASGAELVQALDVYEIVVQYSKISNIKLPELFLRHCASNNLWLPFLIFIQIHDYQLDQVKLMLQFFKNPTLIEHLEHGIVQDIQVEEKHALMMDRDSRKYFLSKVGIKRSLEGRGLNLSQSLKSRESQESEDGSANSDFFEIDIYNFKATLLQTLIRCHNSTDPPKALLQACQLYRNPLLAIFATSYEPDSVITNWLTWLAVSCELCQAFTNYESTAISGIAVTHLLENCLRDKFPKAILESFQIFLPENPLKPFVELINNLLNFELNSSVLEANLDSFRALTSGLRKNCILSENDHEMTYLSNRIWIETTALRLLSAVLDCNCSSVYQEIIIVDALVKLKISDYFSITSPNFENILEILKALHEINTDLRLDFDVIFDCKNSRHAIVNCINSLLDNNNYEAALKIARIEGLPPDLILIKEWQFKMNNESDLNFWTNCDKVFDENGVTADCVIDFYTDCVERISDTFDKFTVLKLAWQWAARFDLTCQYELEKKMWLSYLHLDEKQKDLKIFDLTPQVCLYKDLVEMLENVNEYDGELSKDLMRQMERVVLLVLNKSNFWLALKLQKMFGCQNTDLETLKLCHSLAEGILMPYQLDAQQRLLLSNIQYLRSYSHRRTFLSTRLSSLSSSTLSLANSSLAPTSDAPDSATNDVLTILKLLVEHLHNGTEIGQNVFMTYRISVNIEIPYQIVVVTSDCMQILRDALGDDCMNKLDVVHDFVSVYKWTKEEVADFICEELINATTRYIEFSIDQLIMWDVNINHDFQLVLQLLQDNCSILGNKIYSYAKTLHKSHLESLPHLKPADLALIVELIIKSHDCFTADCNMEGISTILKISKEIVLQLLVLQCWKLIVRLLTGVGRYTEMNYIFQILKENDQFEYLLRKNVRKDNSLKVALLEYLQKFCPDNHDLYKIVALHFTLFSEVAALWEKEAENVVMNLIGIAKLEMQNDKLNLDEEPFILFQNNEGTRICLNKAMENYVHATEFHLQGEKLTKAAHSSKQAEMVALQLRFLNEIPAKSSTVCLLHLNNVQITSLISSKLTFEQALILTEAYNYHANWASILYEQYLANNNKQFFEAFVHHIPLTDSLVQEISRRFINSNINTVDGIKCMKNVLRRMPSLNVKYRIASELGFTDLVEELISSGKVVYLRDTVWKKGYRN